LPVKAPFLRRFFVLLVIAWILAKILFVLYEGFFLPEHTSDSWEHWSLGAKFLYYEKGLALDPSNEHFFGTGYLKVQRYPLNVPLMQVWSSICVGEAHEIYMKVWSALLFVSMVGLLFCALRRKTTTTTALLASFFLSTVPLLTYHALTAYADLPLSFYALGGLICFWDILDARQSGPIKGPRGMLVLMGTCAALCAWTKVEGLFYVAAFSVSLMLYSLINKIPLKRGIAYLAPLALITAPWYVFLLFIGVPISYGEERMLEEAIAKGIHFEVLPLIAEQVLFSANFNIIFPALLLLTVLGCRSIVRSGLAYLYTVVLTVMVMFLALYLGTESYRWVMNLTAVNRNILTFIPMMFYLAALTAHRLLQREAVTDCPDGPT
jgi:4-amino-4-deoxy-L-arabinose transferase-like glycosyltransferase